MNLKERFQYWSNIKSGKQIPLMNIVIDITRPNTDKNVNVFHHPSIANDLTKEQIDELNYHLCKVIDVVRDNIDIKKLK